MNINRKVWGAVMVVCAAMVAGGQVPVAGGKGARLSDIAGTDTLVTVVLKASGAQDSNLKVVSVDTGLLTVRSQSGELNHYLLADVQEVRVQGNVMTVKHLDPLLDRGLTPEQQQVVARGVERANDLLLFRG